MSPDMAALGRTEQLDARFRTVLHLQPSLPAWHAHGDIRHQVKVESDRAMGMAMVLRSENHAGRALRLRR